MRAPARYIVLLLLGGFVGALALVQAQPRPSEPRTIEVAAERFSFTPSELRTTVGTTLRIELHSEDTDHGFRILGTDINLEIPKRGRGTVSVDFTPDRAGRYTFECSHVCGAGHSFMRGEIVVVDRQAE